MVLDAMFANLPMAPNLPLQRVEGLPNQWQHVLPRPRNVDNAAGDRDGDVEFETAQAMVLGGDVSISQAATQLDDSASTVVGAMVRVMIRARPIARSG
jgi:hypothetical protein